MPGGLKMGFAMHLVILEEHIDIRLTNDPLHGARVFHMVWPEDRSRSPSGRVTSPIGSSLLNLS